MTQGKPAIREPQPCGRDDYPSSGREPSQLGWYEWIARRHAGQHIIDVGAGMGAGVAYMSYLGAGFVQGFDIDPRLADIPQMTIGTSPLKSFGPASCDVVTCIDCIEHVVDDATLIDEMKAMATEAVYVSTPNFSRSGAGNHCHAREYTIDEFANVFEPDEIWVASPDGWYHRTLLLKREHLDGRFPQVTNEYDGTSWELGAVPERRFNDGSPDGLEWAHFCGVFLNDA
jgi:2-polyprenyl-3-methyl-5-hydroxy-6-metoxy-1,4-benzoquinol methylase